MTGNFGRTPVQNHLQLRPTGTDNTQPKAKLLGLGTICLKQIMSTWEFLDVAVPAGSQLETNLAQP